MTIGVKLTEKIGMTTGAFARSPRCMCMRGGTNYLDFLSSLVAIGRVLTRF